MATTQSSPLRFAISCAVALHRVDAAEERIARTPIDRHGAREVGGRQRDAGVTQRGQDRGARRQERRVDVGAVRPRGVRARAGCARSRAAAEGRGFFDKGVAEK